MLLLCPHCGYRREISAPAPPPPGPVQVVCAACSREFSLEPGDSTFSFETAASDISVVSAEPALADSPRAGFWVRVCASLIDSAILTLTQTILGALLGVMLTLLVDGFDSESLTTLGLIWLFGCTIGLAYYVLFTAHGGQTPGKMALRIKVIRSDGGEIGLGKACYRETVCKFVSAIIFGIGYLMVAFDPQKQGLHDRMADTYVVKL